MQSALGAVPPVLGRITDAHGHSTDAEPLRRLYNSKRWRDLRDQVLLDAGYQCQWDDCGRIEANTSKLVAHHICAHRGDVRLFWDRSNLMCVCKACHDGPIAAEEARQRAVGVL